MTPFVSVVIPCRDEARFIGPCLESVLAADYLAFEVIVADGMSTDGTRDILASVASRDARFRLIDNPERITPVALNRAIREARGEVILRFDGHAVMPKDYIRRCVNLLVATGADNAGGSIRTVAQSDGPFSGAIVEVLSSRFGVGNSSFRTSGASEGVRQADTVFGGCWPRDLFSRIGYFNERLRRSQDIEFNLRIARAGGKIMLDPKIACDYYARAALVPFWRHNFINGVWAVLPFAHSEIIPVRLRHLVPLAFVASLTASLGAPIFVPSPLGLIVPALYAAVNLAASAQIAIRRRQIRFLALMPIAFGSLHLAYGLGSAWGLAKLVAEKLPHRSAAVQKAAHPESEPT